MFTAQQYEAIGRFALAFNEIEFYLEWYIEQFIDGPEWAVATVLAEEGNFSAKRHRYTKVLSALAEQHPTLKSATDAATVLANEAEEVAKKRNRYIHALVVEDLGSKQPILRIKRTTEVFNEVEVAGLTTQARELAEKLSEASAEVLVMLDEKRRSN